MLNPVIVTALLNKRALGVGKKCLHHTSER